MKEKIVKSLSEKYNLPSSIVERVFSHQFDSISSALELNNSVEISGLCKFVFNKKKAERQVIEYRNIVENLNNLYNKTDCEKEQRNILLKLHTIETNLNILNKKLCLD